jgi:hypothetical protein
LGVIDHDQSSDVKGPKAVSVTNIRRRRESQGRGAHHKATDLHDGPLDDVGLIVGRDHERRILGGLIDSPKVGGGAAAIYGEPGMGKTSLLNFIADRAKRSGAQVLTACGMESEAVLPFAAITDLLWPLQTHFATLPAILREALEVRLALSAGPPRGPLAACAGALGVLSAAADERPLVILVDDFQRLDAGAGADLAVRGASPS